MPSELAKRIAERIHDESFQYIEIDEQYSFSEVTAQEIIDDSLAGTREALEALTTMMDRGPQPKKFDEAMSWRDNDIHARKLADAALAALKVQP